MNSLTFQDSLGTMTRTIARDLMLLGAAARLFDNK